MRYIVIKPFADPTGFRVAGDTIELDDNRAAKLRRYGLIGGKQAENEPLKEKELENLTGIYPESKQYEKKLNKVRNAKKVK